MKNKHFIELHKNYLLDALQQIESDYNPRIQLLSRPFSSPGYHTTLKGVETVHPTRDAAKYALALLDSELPQYEQRAFDILYKVISLQDTNRDNDTYGIWSWFYEEPLTRMAPPDWNWADFIGKLLVVGAKRHGHRMPAELRSAVEESVAHACEAIIIRDVGPSYTNIAIMGALVTIIAGEHYERQEIKAYGLQRLESFYEFSQRLGTFQEYNSPAYTLLAIAELSKLHTESNDERVRSLSTNLLNMSWKSVASHFHPASRQWAGPHSRSYSTLLNRHAQSFIQLATGGTVVFCPWERLAYDTEWYGNDIDCPQSYYRYFLNEEEREIREVYERNEQTKEEKLAVTYMTPAFTLGTFREDIAWNQRRCFIAYVRNGLESVYLRMRVLHDGYDYCSAVISAAQHRSQALIGVRYLTHGGDTHPNLDRINGTIEASDLRIRFELGGNVDGVSGSVDGDTVHIRIDETLIAIKRLYAVFSNGQSPERQWQWEQSQQRKQPNSGENDDGSLNFDCVIHAGERKTIDFRTIERAAMLFSFAMGGTGVRSGEPDLADLTLLSGDSVEELDDAVLARMSGGDCPLELQVKWKPQSVNR